MKTTIKSQTLYNFFIIIEKHMDTLIDDLYEDGHIKMIEELCTTYADQSKVTAIHVAAKHGNVDILDKMRCVLPKINFNVQTEYGWTPLMYAAQKNQVEAVKFLLDNNVDTNVTVCSNLQRVELNKEIRQFDQDTRKQLYTEWDNAAAIAVKFGSTECFKILYQLSNKEYQSHLKDLTTEYGRENMLKFIENVEEEQDERENEDELEEIFREAVLKLERDLKNRNENSAVRKDVKKINKESDDEEEGTLESAIQVALCELNGLEDIENRNEDNAEKDEEKIHHIVYYNSGENYGYGNWDMVA